jgi:hypothetical protein
VTTSTAFAAFGLSSGLGSSATSRLEYASSTDFAWTGDCTLEFWIYIPGAISGQPFFMATGPGRYLTLNSDRIIGFTGYMADSTPALAIGQWHHIAITRSAAGQSRLWINGEGRAPVGASGDSASAPFGVFNLPGRLDLPSLSGVHLDEVRWTRNVQRYTENFTPEQHLTVGMTGLSPVPIQGSVISTLGPVVPPLVFFDEVQTGRVINGPAEIDTWYGGTHRIRGTVKEKNTPVNTPLARRVVLLDRRTHRTVQSTWSDATTGNYEFRNIAPSSVALDYTIVSYDHTTLYRAVIADNVPTEPMT